MYKECMKRDGEYTCNISFDMLPLLGWAHKSIPPNQGLLLLAEFVADCNCTTVLQAGSVKIMEARHFTDPEGKVVCPTSWSEVLVIRAISGTEPPKTDVECLNGDAYSQSLIESESTKNIRMKKDFRTSDSGAAFLISWAKASSDVQKRFKQLARAVRATLSHESH